MSSLPTGTVTFLFTDIEGSTTLLQRLGDRRYAEVLAEHHRLLRDVFAKGNGQEIDTQGDAFLVAFTRARDAVTTAVAAQQALTKHGWPDGASLRVRMGLHTGEPLSGETGYVGIDVHRAARIASAGHGGQILLSDAVSGLAARDLPPGVTLRDLGTHRLKDLQQPEHLLQVVHPDLPGDFPPPKSLDARPNNLPRQLTSFIGREKEMAEVKRLLSIAYLVTLTGSGGAGKTRLALQVAADVVEGYPDGVWLAEFAPIADPVLVPKTVASALSVPEQPGRDMTETLVDALRPKALLLVLDNCEHLLAACANLAVILLRACPQVRILATSREGLDIPGEILWRVPSLSLPDSSVLPRDFLKYDAVRLFSDRAVATSPGFVVTHENAQAVKQVCQRLDGIPLAIELAAARVKVLAVEQIVDRLDDRFRLLTGGSRMVLPRHQTLRGAIDWSYNLLLEPEKILLRRLAIFAGGWALEAAEAVCAGGRLEADRILDLLTSLINKSLVLAETHHGEIRYRLLETVRQYGRDRLVESRETEDMRRRHRDWLLALAEQADPELHKPKERIWLERLEMEHDNLRAALEWSMAEIGGAEAGLRLAAALMWFWHRHGHWSEAHGWFEEVLARSIDVPPSMLPKALNGATFFAWRQGDNERVIAMGEKGLALCRELGDRENGAMLLWWLSNVAMQQGDYERATALLEESLMLGRGTREKWLESTAIFHLGEVARYQGNYERAVGLHEQSLSLLREVGDISTTANVLRHLGMDMLRRGDYGRATEHYRDSLSKCREVGNRWVPIECLNGLADVVCAQQHYEQAARLFGAAEALREALRLRPSPPDQNYHEQCMASTRARLGDSIFEAAWAEGRAMTLEQAIEYALAVETD